ncbi:MAG: hypothetical protein ABJN26_08450 [Stappiaceae bacterium]
MSLIFRAIGGAVVVGGVYTYTAYDKATNYVPVSADIQKVETLCYGTKTERGLVSKTKKSTKEVDCDLLRSIVSNHPEYKGYSVHSTTYVSYEYKWPESGQHFSGRHKQKMNDDGNPVKRGDTIQILVSKTDPEKTRHL